MSPPTETVPPLREILDPPLVVPYLNTSQYVTIGKYMLNQRLLASVTSFFMFANTHLYPTSQRHDVTLTLIAIIYAQNCQFLKTGLVEYIGVLQTPIKKTVYKTLKFQMQFVALVTS